MASTITKISPGRWQVSGATCSCGGSLFIDRNGNGDFKYETWCAVCRKCDPNGWPTLQGCVGNLDYFSPANAKGQVPHA